MNIPYDILYNHILTRLDYNNLNKLRATSKELNNSIENSEIAKKIIKDKINDSFGTVTTHEQQSISSMHAVANLHPAICSLKPNETSYEILTFIDGRPQLLPESTYFKNCSIWETFSKRYQIYRNNVSDDTAQQIINIYQNHLDTLNELLRTPYATDCPGQDLRDRIIRIKNIEKERDILTKAVQATKCDFSLIEKIIFWVIDFFHSLWEPAKMTLKEMCHLHLPATSKDFTQKKGAPVIAKTEIILNEKKIPLGILLEQDTFNDRIRFVNLNSQEILGEIHLHKAWIDSKEPFVSLDEMKELQPGLSESYIHCMTHRISKETTLSEPFIFAEIYFRNKLIYAQDTSTGNYPLMNVLVQLLVEITEKEPVEHLILSKIVDYGNELNIVELCAMGGFYTFKGRYIDGRPNIDSQIDDIGIQVREYRKEHQKLYPDRSNNKEWVFQYFKAVLDKNCSSAHNTKFFRKNAEGVSEPAYVESDLNGTKKTWEEVIQEKPILKDITGTVLPRFWERDLSKQAVKN